MAQDEDHLTESNSNINTENEISERRFSLTMEVPLFLTMLGLALSGTAISNIILYRTCVHSLHHTADDCHVFLVPEKNNGTRQLEEEVQKYAAMVQMVKTVIESVGPAVLSMFLGVWSDKHGRKPLVVWPLFGNAMSLMLIVIFSVMEDLGPWWYILTLIPNVLSGGVRILITGMFLYICDISTIDSRSFSAAVAASERIFGGSMCITMTAMLTVIYSMLGDFGPWWYLLTVIPFSFTGGFSVIFTGAFCYLSDVTSTESRSLRMTVLEASVSAGSVIGSLLSSHLLKAVGNVYLLLIVSALYVIAYIFTNVFLRESVTGAVQGGISSVLDTSLVKEMFRECFKRRPNNLRAQLLLLTIANSLSVFVLYGLFGLDYLYTREQLQWSLKDYTTFSATSTAISFTGSFIGVAILQKVFPITDLALAMVSFLSTAAEYMVKAFAVVTWHMYLGSSISLFGGLSAPLIRSMLTKILPVEDKAKVFALMCAIEGICPLISPVLYNALYRYTISVFPGAICVLTSYIAVVCATMLGFVAYFRWKNTTPSYEPVENEE